MKLAIIIAGTLGCAALCSIICASLFVESGLYNIGADDHHTKFVFGIIMQLRNRSIEVRSRDIEVHEITDQRRLAAGAQRYSALCSGCHLAPGNPKSDIRTGMYPHPPSLAQQEVQEPKRAFWIIKHGIKMSAMPSWAKVMDDDAIWEVVAFVRKLPDMSPAAYEELSRRSPGPASG
jgi:mono/diheme cytochrome c family protein